MFTEKEVCCLQYYIGGVTLSNGYKLSREDTRYRGLSSEYQASLLVVSYKLLLSALSSQSFKFEE